MQFSEAIMEYSFDCKIRKLSAKTIENYQKQLRYRGGIPHKEGSRTGRRKGDVGVQRRRPAI